MPQIFWNPLAAMPDQRDFECYHYAGEGGYGMPAFHAHHHYEFYIYLSGNTHIAVEENLYKPEPYTLFIYPPGTMHRHVSKVNIGHYDRAYIYVMREYVKRLSTPDFPMLNIIEKAMDAHAYSFRLGAQEGSLIVSQIDDIIQHYRLSEPADILLNQCRFHMLMISLCRLISPDTKETVNVPSRMRDVIAYINAHLTEHLSLDILADQFYVSKYYLLHAFKDYANLSLHQYIISKRVIHAQKLMREGTAPGEAARLSGFNDYAGFYRAFVKQTGVTPQQFCKGSFSLK